MSAPARQRPRTYLAHAEALSTAHGPGPWPRGGEPLPDETPDPDRLMSETVLDGVRTHHSGGGDDHDGLAAALAERICASTDTTMPALHDALAAVSPVSIADDLIAELRRRRPSRRRIRDTGRWLATNGTRRGAVATGIVLLGLAGDERDRDLLLLLGALESLTLYAVVALANTQPDRDRAIYELARRVDGWGRIHAVERLEGTADPEIRSWLLRDGYRNQIMDEYLAWTAATTGDLAGALAADTVDDALLAGAGGILLALHRGGPARDMRDYPDGRHAVDRYLHHVARAEPDLIRIGVVAALGETAGERGAELTARPDWRAVIERALDSDDPEEFDRATWPAGLLGIGFADRLARWLRRRPFDHHLWFSLVDDHDDVDLVIDVATEVLPLSEMITGPGMDLGLGPDQPGRVLDVIVSRLDRHPGKGWPLISVALRNLIVRNRHMAMNVLEAWPAAAVPPEAYRMVREAAAIEPDPGVRERLEAFAAAGRD